MIETDKGRRKLLLGLQQRPYRHCLTHAHSQAMQGREEQVSPGCSSSLHSGCKPNHHQQQTHCQTLCLQQLLTGDVLRSQQACSVAGLKKHSKESRQQLPGSAGASLLQGHPQPPLLAGGRAVDAQPEPQPEHGQREKLSAMQWAAFWLHDRPAPFDNCMVTHGARLFQEWCVDQYCKVEAQRLRYILTHQQQLRVDLYRGVVDAVLQDNVADMGRMVVLPSSFTGGPRHMQQLYQDAMALVRKHGKPDLFITITCNPKCVQAQVGCTDGGFGAAWCVWACGG